MRVRVPPPALKNCILLELAFEEGMHRREAAGVRAGLECPDVYLSLWKFRAVLRTRHSRAYPNPHNSPNSAPVHPCLRGLWGMLCAHSEAVPALVVCRLGHGKYSTFG